MGSYSSKEQKIALNFYKNAENLNEEERQALREFEIADGWLHTTREVKVSLLNNLVRLYKCRFPLDIPNENLI